MERSVPACRWRRGLFPYLPPSCCPASGTVCSPSRKENSADRKPEVEMDSLKKRPPPLKAGGLSPAPFRIQPQGAITTRASQKGPRVIRGIDSRVSAWPLNLICLFCLLSVVSVLISPALVPGSPAWLSAVSASSTRAGLSEAPSSYKIPTNTSNANDGESREKDGKRADDFGYHAGASQPDGSRRKEERAATLRAGPDEFAEHLYLQGLKREGWYSATFEFELRAQIPVRLRSRAGRPVSSHHHYDIFPKEIGKLLNLSPSFPSPSSSTALPAPSILFFDASLTQGRWPEEAWGPAPSPIRPPGAVLRAGLSTGPVYDTQRTWSLLTHALGGILCTAFTMLKHEEMPFSLSPSFLSDASLPSSSASLGAENSAGRTEEGSGSVRSAKTGAGGESDPGEDAEDGDLSSPHWKIRVATSPLENACTENFTSLQKLLPCKGEAGLLTLIHPLVFAASPFKSLRFLAYTEDAEDVRTSVKSSFDSYYRQATFRAFLTIVLPVPSPAALFTLPDLFLYDKNDVLHSRQPSSQAQNSLRSCPASSSSRVYLRLHLEAGQEEEAGTERQDGRTTESRFLAKARAAVHTAGATPFAIHKISPTEGIVVFDAFPKKKAPEQAGASGGGEKIFALEALAVPSDYEDLNRLEVEKQQTGRGQDSTKLERMEGAWLFVFRNHSPLLKRTLRVFDHIPPFVTPLLHTLRASWTHMHATTSTRRRGGKRPSLKARGRQCRPPPPYSSHAPLFGASVARALRLRMRVPAERLDVSPALMSLSFSLPPRCQLEVSLGVQKKFLPGSRFAFSPDKGLDVGGAIVLDKSSSEFIWPPPSTVLRAPLTCNNVQCEVLSLSKALPSSSSFEEANQQRKQAEGRGHGKTSSEGSRARGRGMEMTSREEEERKGSVRASTAEGLYVEGVKNSWTWRFTEGMIVHVPLPDFSMPFNVIALSGTVITLFYGPIFRITSMEW